MTNREKINQMSNGELADKIHKESENYCEYCIYKGQFCTGKWCAGGILEWLEQEAEE